MKAMFPGDFRHASISVGGDLPTGDPAYWAQSVTDLVCGLRRDGGVGRFANHLGTRLEQAQIDAAMTALLASEMRAGDVVIVEAVNTLPTIAMLLALWELGGVICPIDPECPPHVRALVAEESGALFTVTQEGEVQKLARGRSRPLVTLRRPKRITGVDLALMIFTSGSSGRPKGVVLTHANMMSALRAICGFLKITKEDRILAIPPFFFDYGLYQILFALMTGAELIVANEHRSVAKLAPILAQVEPTILPVVPALASGLGRMLEISKRNVPSVRLVTNTGGHLSEATMDLLARIVPNARMVPMYGLTECKRALYCDRGLYPDAADCVGVAMPGLDVAVVAEGPDGSLYEAATGEVGELWVRGTSVMQEYRGMAAAGEGARLIPGRYRADNWLATGDLFRRDDRGLLVFKGRAKSLIKQGGYSIVPRDVEEMVEALASVEAAVLVARQEDSGDEAAVLFLQPVAEDSALLRQAIRAELKALLPRSMQPREIVFVSQWPATANGKIDRKALAEEFLK
jgi:long-chain acyl-CoA synthetase